MAEQEKPIGPARPEQNPDVGATRKWVDTWAIQNRAIQTGGMPSLESSGKGAEKAMPNSNIHPPTGLAQEADDLSRKIPSEK